MNLNGLYVILFLCFPFISCGQGIAPPPAPSKQAQDSISVVDTLPKKVRNLARFEGEIKKMEEGDRLDPKPQQAVLFVGSSSIRFWKTLTEDMAPMPVINRGFGGAVTAEVNYYFHRIVSLHKPRILVLYAGENDLFNPDVSIDSVALDFKAFRDSVSLHLPNTRCFFVSVKPSPARWGFQEKFTQANARFKAICEAEPQWEYIDVVSAMLNGEGNPKPEIFKSDKLHLNVAGYLLWKNKIKPRIQKEWKELQVGK